MQGMITDIHRTSLVDGPGLRTTVFIKGCPLRCLWCHNPETQVPRIQPAFDAEKANDADRAFLGLTAEEWNSEKRTSLALDKIRELGIELCVRESTSGAISTYGKVVSVEEVMTEVLKDRPYFNRSGGGITLSGGEPMHQSDFALSLLKESKLAGLHTVLDTTGYMPPDQAEATLPVTDLYLFDYKATSDSQHIQLTGVGLERILSNLDLLASKGAKIWLRCPMIPRLNDTPEHLNTIVSLMDKYNAIQKIDILTWHTMGSAKAARLGKSLPDPLPDSNTSEADKARYRNFFELNAPQHQVEVL